MYVIKILSISYHQVQISFEKESQFPVTILYKVVKLLLKYQLTYKNSSRKLTNIRCHYK